ncbi:DUF3143 domain-containing protein [Thalassoporum mexicanum]|uniref:DUF3143 domain-containing protein n=1 Tax=Thalassoporum mexicanum TaxID=3457544 RepID=UPI0005A22843|nr:DUF3143 domain-containing protein [Pseudanabaena sp. PCC 7367]
MPMPPATTPLYNHPLPVVEYWLRSQGCTQAQDSPSRWYVKRPEWEADIYLDVEEVQVRYINASAGKDVMRAFPYSLSRHDIEDAIFTGP